LFRLYPSNLFSLSLQKSFLSLLKILKSMYLIRIYALRYLRSKGVFVVILTTWIYNLLVYPLLRIMIKSFWYWLMSNVILIFFKLCNLIGAVVYLRFEESIHLLKLLIRSKLLHMILLLFQNFICSFIKRSSSFKLIQIYDCRIFRFTVNIWSKCTLFKLFFLQLSFQFLTFFPRFISLTMQTFILTTDWNWSWSTLKIITINIWLERAALQYLFDFILSLNLLSLHIDLTSVPW